MANDQRGEVHDTEPYILQRSAKACVNIRPFGGQIECVHYCYSNGTKKCSTASHFSVHRYQPPSRPHKVNTVNIKVVHTILIYNLYSKVRLIFRYAKPGIYGILFLLLPFSSSPFSSSKFSFFIPHKKTHKK
jgi:hypothetical protein